ncbi:MAG: ubiquitin-like domain-containing protein, partial [Chloroflexota bacterium]|nr:ubiquitin-like domain-containing protein [Chloroflexota bacterium]
MSEHFSQERYGTIMNMSSIRIIILTSILLLAGCQQVDQPSSDTITISLMHDKVRNTVDTSSTNVGNLLSEQGIEIGPLDRTLPSQSTLLTDGMDVTIIRVAEELQNEEI